MGSKRSDGFKPSVTLRSRLAEIDACEKSGESLKGYAERRGLSVHMLYQAKKIARQQGLLPPYRSGKPVPVRSKEKRAPRFVEAVVATVRQPPAAWRLRFAGGEVLESSTALDVEVALRLIESLGVRS